jgi:hypothetical protein
MDVTVCLDGDLDTGLRADLASGLREELLDRGLDAAAPAASGRPDGSKSADLLAWGSLLVSVASVASFRTVIEALSSWLRRQPQDIVIEVDGATLSGVVSPEQRAQLVDAFTERLRRAGQSGPPISSPEEVGPERTASGN